MNTGNLAELLQELKTNNETISQHLDKIEKSLDRIKAQLKQHNVTTL